MPNLKAMLCFCRVEVISLVNDNVPLKDICAGVTESIARRIKGMIYKVGLTEDLALTGGCAQNKALAVALEHHLGVSLVHLPENPQHYRGARSRNIRFGTFGSVVRRLGRNYYEYA